MTDKTSIIPSEFKLASNIKIIGQSNKGLRLYRNEGLKYSVGHYLWFIDSDDWIVENCLAYIISKLEKITMFSNFSNRI